jgi:hypothetical protein
MQELQIGSGDKQGCDISGTEAKFLESVGEDIRYQSYLDRRRHLWDSSRVIRPRYRHEAAGIAGFIQQLAVSYVCNGYFFYVLGRVPAGKDPAKVDAKLLERYGIHMSKWSRARRKRAGKASIQYLRHGERFLLLATHGEHPFFAEEGNSIRDCRRVPIKVFGYAVSSKRGHAHVRIDLEEFRRLKARVLELAVHRNAKSLTDFFWSLPFEPYAPVRRQLLQLLRLADRKRSQAGYEQLPWDILRFRRRIVRPFGEVRLGSQDAA